MTIAARSAAVIVGLEALGLFALAAWQVLAIMGGDTAALESAFALIVLTVVGAGIVGLFAGAAWRGVSWGRSGAIVVQLLILAVALGAATGSYASPLTALALAVPAALALVLLIAGARSTAPRIDRDDDPA